MGSIPNAGRFGFQFISSLKSNNNTGNKDVCVESFLSSHALLVHLFNLVMNETFVQLLSFDSHLIPNTLDWKMTGRLI